MKKFLFFCFIISLFAGHANAQDDKQQDSNHDVALPRFGDNWYVQVGGDMSLQNPYIKGKEMKDMFSKGRSFGVDAAAGRWFSPEIGLRAKMNWDNGIVKNDKAEWLAGDKNGKTNGECGGYITLTGDLQFDLVNIIAGYRPDRMWNLQIFPRGGVVYNFGVDKGAALIGAGIGNTFRINNRFKIYLDVAYNMVGSGFAGGVSDATGTGTKSNGFATIDAGLQINLGKSGYKNLPKAKTQDDASKESKDGDVDICHRFGDNWYVQAGLGMAMLKPFNKTFINTFPKGRTFGIDLAVGKSFTPEFGVRARMDWQNGIKMFKNDKLEWIGPIENGKSTNIDHHGFITAYLDAPISLSNIIGGYDMHRRWDIYIFPRAGISSNRAIKSCSPLIGGGWGCTYRIKGRWSVYADMAYQATTSEFFTDVACTGLGESTAFNGILDLHAGVQFDLGKSAGKFKRIAK